MSGEALLVAPIGVPFTWSRVMYTAPWANEVTVVSRTSVKLIREVLINKELKPRVVMFAQDTIAAYSRFDKRGNPIAGTECLPDPLDLPEGYLEPSRYQEFTAKISECIEQWFRSAEDLDVTIHVLPGFGEHVYKISRNSEARATWTLHPDLRGKGVEPMEYLMGLQSIHLIASLEDAFRGEDAEIHVDLTHGLNYAGYSLYRSVLFAARVYAATYMAKVRITLYNSEPYVPGARRLNVWIVRSETVKPRAAASRLVYTTIATKCHDGKYTCLRPPDVLSETKDHKGKLRAALAKKFRGSNYEKDNQGDVTARLRRAGWAAAAAVITGAPLLLAQAGVEGKGLPRASFILKVMRELIPYVHVAKPSANEVIINHEAAINYYYLRKLLALLALAHYSSHTLGIDGVSIENKDSRLCRLDEKGGRSLVAVASLDSLEVIARDFIAGPSRDIVEREVSSFKAALQGQASGADYMIVQCAAITGGRAEDPAEKKKVFDSKSFDLRIFTAHAGLTRRLLTVEYTPSGNPASSLKLYYDPCLLDIIYNGAQKLMERFAENVFE
ncbi:MAG: CRISPR-associated DxTHG motif protein [Desulfurococcales archaeon]|nr:CRISPR-associated DxTHG motif protein [Desulfurococcales archaeon]